MNKIENEDFGNKILFFQKEFTVNRKRGCHVITDEVLKSIPELKKIKIGMLNLFLKHTSASLIVNECYDPNVLKDLNNYLDRNIPDDESLYIHNDEGADDASSHIKNAFFGHSINIPITNGSLNLGTWQGIIFCEFRNMKSNRTIVATIQGTS